MTLAPWQQEWVRFDNESIKDMKRHADNTHTHREWMCYVYEQDYGILVPGSNGGFPVMITDGDSEDTLIIENMEEAQAKAQEVGGTAIPVYRLGSPSYGSESRIEVNPQAKSVEDRLSDGLRPENRKCTIHGHPLKDGKIYTGRQYFSSTDLVNEFCHARDNDEEVVQFLVYPHQQNGENNAHVIHNRCRILIFPDRETMRAAMSESNPGVDFDAITTESGQNSSVDDGSGGTTLVNDAGVNWFEFQEALGRLGYMGIVDIEGPTGGMIYHSEGFASRLRSAKPLQVLGMGVGLIILGIFAKRTYSSMAKGESTDISTVAGAEGMNVEGGNHFWHN